MNQLVTTNLIKFGLSDRVTENKLSIGQKNSYGTIIHTVALVDIYSFNKSDHNIKSFLEE